ncbi:sulfite exporter TauE/SafE family protein [Geobacter sp. DSM 9736]|uniref:sulfite exporter TauE/SafE family protein n=1 Tax=Geobacter sp. DSM 9736 TaxID=1277350 RepID=UPI000B511F34|nr:sulfite exporter TauE/SafE family protein [Geobacter sp. DSM 9736]SNB45964.1 Uncharacterized membrane protein YfcA [Geobacter sp. DSM 9736]
MIYWMAYLLVGSCAGILAGLLGVGGGIIIVPMLTFLFSMENMPAEHIAHLSLGTSLASIVFTSISSFRTHHAHGAVKWQIVRRISPGIVAGTLFGSWVAARLTTGFLKGFFVLFIYVVAVQMLLNVKPAPHRELPGVPGMSFSGSIIGCISSLVGIGGGSMSVPFMLWCNTPLHIAIGTSAAIGLPIAAAGAIGYIANGLAASNLPSMSAGFVYIPALIGISGASICTAPIGARLAHRLPVLHLKRIFAIMLIGIGTKMLLSLG